MQLVIINIIEGIKELNEIICALTKYQLKIFKFGANNYLKYKKDWSVTYDVLKQNAS